MFCLLATRRVRAGRSPPSLHFICLKLKRVPRSKYLGTFPGSGDHSGHTWTPPCSVLNPHCPEVLPLLIWLSLSSWSSLVTLLSRNQSGFLSSRHYSGDIGEGRAPHITPRSGLPGALCPAAHAALLFTPTVIPLSLLGQREQRPADNFSTHHKSRDSCQVPRSQVRMFYMIQSNIVCNGSRSLPADKQIHLSCVGMESTNSTGKASLL